MKLDKTDRRILVIHAHPDDEAISTGGLLARCNIDGIVSCLVICTDGRHGPVNPQLGLSVSPEQLAEIRSNELSTSTIILGLNKVEHLPYYDSGMLGSTTNFHPRAFCYQKTETLTREFVRILRKWQPHIVVTYDPFGFTGHPDHIQAHRISLLAIEAAAEPRIFQELGDAWEVSKVYYPVYPISDLERLIREQLSMSMAHPFNGLSANKINFASPDNRATHRVNISSVYEIKKKALNSHQTQIGPHNPALYLAALGRRNFEHFRLAYIRKSDPYFDDLFETIP